MKKIKVRKKQGTCLLCGKAYEKSRVNQRTCSRECSEKYWKRRRRGRMYRHVCGYCGVEFEQLSTRKRKYCSRECNGMSKRRKNMPKNKGEKPKNKMPTDYSRIYTSIVLETIRLYREGYSVSVIAELLKITKGGVQHCCHRTPSLWYTKNSAEWLEVFRYQTKSLLTEAQEESYVNLVCERANGGLKGLQLSEIIIENLKSNPYNGEKYAFCSKYDDIINIIQFDGKGIMYSSRQKQSGKYIWPKNTFGGMITISEQEFNLILNERIGR